MDEITKILEVIRNEWNSKEIYYFSLQPRTFYVYRYLHPQSLSEPYETVVSPFAFVRFEDDGSCRVGHNRHEVWDGVIFPPLDRILYLADPEFEEKVFEILKKLNDKTN